jgi:hypothetical protein
MVFRKCVLFRDYVTAPPHWMTPPQSSCKARVRYPLMNEGLPDLRRSRDLRALTGRANVRPLCLALNAAGVAIEQLAVDLHQAGEPACNWL